MSDKFWKCLWWGCGHEIDGAKDEPCPYCRITELEAELDKAKRDIQVLDKDNWALRPVGWTITYNPKPIPTRDDDWDYVHDDYDGENGLCGTAGSYLEAIRHILDRE
jgi:hypothetical protein